MTEVASGHIGGMSESPDGVGVVVDNRTGLPDDQVFNAVYAHWVETAAFQFGQPSTFQLYANNEGSLLARMPFRVPKDIIEEITLARAVAETDDDVQAAIGQQIASAFRDGMQNQHEDEQTLGFFNAWASDVNLDGLLKEMYREYLIAGQFTTLSMFTRKRLDFTPLDTETPVQAQLAVPVVGILPAEHLRVIETDLFGNGALAYEVTNSQMKLWLDEYFGDRTTEARRFQMRTANPVVAAVFTGRKEIPWSDPDLTIAGKTLYTLNERMVKRTTMPKGASAYPRPLLTSNFALLEAKRLLNVMDYALLQGGTNYIVVAKQGSDKLPAQQPEIDNLIGQIKVASRSGVMVGDHRLDIEIITPELKELLNPEKRNLVGRKITQALMRLPEQVTQDGGTEGIKSEMTLAENTVTSDRRDIKRHVERHLYKEMTTRNVSKFKKGPPKLWFPRIILSGTADFFDAVLKSRDRGDIPRKYGVEMLGFDFEAGVEQRRREKASGLDDLMIPGDVPFSSPQAGPQDNNPGRPRGTSPGNGRNRPSDPPARARPRRVINRTPGETIRAEWNEESQATARIGVLTEQVLEQYPGMTVGRISQFERESALSRETYNSGPVAVVPVNLDYEVATLRVLRLDDGLSMVVGVRSEDRAMVAKALIFREPHWSLDDAEETARRWGFDTPEREEAIEDETAAALAVAPDPEALVARVMEAMAETIKNLPTPQIYVTAGDGRARRMRVVRDPETNEIIGSEPVPEGE